MLVETTNLGQSSYYLPLEPLEAGDKGVKVVDGVIGGEVGGGGIGDAGDNGGHLLLDGAVVGSDGLLVVLKGDSEELVLQLQGLRDLGEV